LGNLREIAYFGTDGNPCLINDGYAKAKLQYDELGKTIEEAFFGTDGNPCIIDDGYAKWTKKIAADKHAA
jgi:hypothetical protein